MVNKQASSDAHYNTVIIAAQKILQLHAPRRSSTITGSSIVDIFCNVDRRQACDIAHYWSSQCLIIFENTRFIGNVDFLIIFIIMKKIKKSKFTWYSILCFFHDSQYYEKKKLFFLFFFGQKCKVDKKTFHFMLKITNFS